jgi:hypothetical protein
VERPGTLPFQHLLLLPLIHVFLQPPQEPVLPTQLGQKSLEKREKELFMDSIWTPSPTI